MATEPQITEYLENLGYKGTEDCYSDVYYETEAKLNREQFEEIKKFLQHPFINYAGRNLVITAAKIHHDFLENQEGVEDDPVWFDETGPNISYRDFHIHTKNAGWIFEGKTREFEINDLLAGLCRVDSIQEERG